MKQIFLLTLFGLFILVACASKEPDEKPVSTTFDTITLGIWTSFLTYEDPEKDGTYTESGDLCNRDNTTEFKADSSFSITEGLVFCDPDEPNPTITGAWSLDNNDTELVYIFFADEVRYKILNLSASTLELEYINPNNPTVSSGSRLTLQR